MQRSTATKNYVSYDDVMLIDFSILLTQFLWKLSDYNDVADKDGSLLLGLSEPIASHS